MKPINTFFISLALFAAGCNSDSESATDKMKELSKEDSFKKAHEEPLPATDTVLSGNNVRMNIAGAEPALAYELRVQDSKNYLLIFPEWWGLNTYIKKEAERYFHELKDVNVLALDLYDGKVATTQEEAAKLVQAVDEERIKQIITRAIGRCGPDGRIATLGWCFGGGWSLQTAIMGGDKVTGCVMYYGMPEEDLNALKKLQAPVLGIFGNKDEHITPEIVNKFEADMKKLGKEIKLYRYEADHAFANPSNPHHDKEAADDAFRKTVSFLSFAYNKMNP
jgi:carboxymethylenebutenolidase